LWLFKLGGVLIKNCRNLKLYCMAESYDSMSIYVNIALSILFFISEALPFVKQNNYNGVLDLIHKRFFQCDGLKCKKVGDKEVFIDVKR